MLKEILQEIAKGRGYSRAGLARRLDISEDVLEQMMRDLARKGYLAPLSPTQETACGGCSLHQACAGCPVDKVSTPSGWVLTAKGRRVTDD